MHRSILGLAAIALATPAIAQDEWVKVSSSEFRVGAFYSPG